VLIGRALLLLSKVLDATKGKKFGQWPTGKRVLGATNICLWADRIRTFRSTGIIGLQPAGKEGFWAGRETGENRLVRLARSIKGRVKRKNNPGDWKEQKRSPRSPAQVMLRGSGVFALRRSILFS